jgi:hypothetical protein
MLIIMFSQEGTLCVCLYVEICISLQGKEVIVEIFLCCRKKGKRGCWSKKDVCSFTTPKHDKYIYTHDRVCSHICHWWLNDYVVITNKILLPMVLFLSIVINVISNYVFHDYSNKNTYPMAHIDHYELLDLLIKSKIWNLLTY